MKADPEAVLFLLFEHSKAIADFDTKVVSKIDQKWRILTRRRSVKSCLMPLSREFYQRLTVHPKSVDDSALEEKYERAKTLFLITLQTTADRSHDLTYALYCFNICS